MRNSQYERPHNNASGEFAGHSQSSHENANSQLGGESLPSSGKIVLQSDVLESLQSLSRDLDILSPAQVRSRLSSLI